MQEMEEHRQAIARLNMFVRDFFVVLKRNFGFTYVYQPGELMNPDDDVAAREEDNGIETP